MIIIPENRISTLIDEEAAFDAVEQVFASMSAGTAKNFPVVREAIGHEEALYGFKSGFDKTALTLGVKSGGYWPGNINKGLTNHQSTIFLFDASTGQCSAIVGGNLLTALRTAAAAAVSASRLAREDSKILGIVGAGHQAAFQLKAVAAQRAFTKVVGWNRTSDRLETLANAAHEVGLPYESVSLEELGRVADVIVTITSSFAPIVMKDHITPGTHLICMGTDTKGKQEIDPALVAEASCFTDEIAQSISIGECQHAIQTGKLQAEGIVDIGRVINGDHPGRTCRDEITLFDGTGVGLQDLAVAQKVVESAITQGLATEVEF